MVLLIEGNSVGLSVYASQYWEILMLPKDPLLVMSLSDIHQHRPSLLTCSKRWWGASKSVLQWPYGIVPFLHGTWCSYLQSVYMNAVIELYSHLTFLSFFFADSFTQSKI